MISKEEVIHISKLARLELSEAELLKMQKDLSQILDYFDLLKKQKSGKDAFKSSEYIKNNLRKDEVIVKDRGLADTILQSAPDRKERYIKVKAIF